MWLFQKAHAIATLQASLFSALFVPGSLHEV
jgi:hypothetical protein